MIAVVITKEDIIRLIEDCYNEKCRCRKLACLETVAKLLLVAIERVKKEEGCENDG